MQEINLRAPLNQLGFGIFALHYYKELIQNYNINWKLIGGSNEELLNTNYSLYSSLCKEFDINYHYLHDSLNTPLNPNLPLLTIWHHHDLQYEDYDVRAIVHFETDCFTIPEIRSLDLVTKVASCSSWGASVLQQNLQQLNSKASITVAPGIYAQPRIVFQE